MKRDHAIWAQYPEILIVHQNRPSLELEGHKHDEHHLFIPLQGQIRIITENNDMKIGPGKMLFVPPGVSHEFKSSKEKGERLICNLSPKLWNKKDFGQDLLCLPLIQLVKEILFYLLVNKESPISKSLAMALFHTLDEAISSCSKGQSLEHSLARVSDERLIKCIQNFENNTNITLGECAKKSGLSSRTMNRLFKTELSITPKYFQTYLKIEKAKTFLKKKKSVTDACYESGFDSLSSFISNFSKFTGKLPSDWR